MKLYLRTSATSLSFLTTATTLVLNKYICCILPTLLLTLGTGSVSVNLLGIAPWIILLFKYKIFVFIISGLFIVISGNLCFKERNDCCHNNRNKAIICVFNKVFYFISVATWLIGFFFAFVALPL